VPADLIAGLMLAAIAIPEQVATARRLALNQSHELDLAG